MINTGLFTQSLAGADAARARFHVRCSCAAPLSSRPLAPTSDARASEKEVGHEACYLSLDRLYQQLGLTQVEDPMRTKLFSIAIVAVLLLLVSRLAMQSPTVNLMAGHTPTLAFCSSNSTERSSVSVRALSSIPMCSLLQVIVRPS